MAGNLERDLTRSMIGLFKEYVGRGPTHGQSYVDDDLLVVVLRDSMIAAEKTLAEEGEEELVEGIRRVFQDKFRDDACRTVERLTGRKVIAFLSDHDIETDILFEAFVLAEEPPPRTGP